MIHMLATDLDGTLLDEQKQIHPNDWKAVVSLENAGLPVACATGQNVFEANESVRGVPVNWH